MAGILNSRIFIEKGDITEMQVDAIVNAANKELVLGGGVAGAIREKGGPSIQRECDRIGSIPLGEAVVTGAGLLPADYVIHAAAMGTREPCTEDSLRNAVINSLKRAEEWKFAKIAMPAVGMGIAGFPVRNGAEILLHTVRDFFESHEYPEEVHIVLFDDETYQTFMESAKHLG
ncbi:MAG TPA: macro domain-containing protein [Acidobacteriota bacterium]|jgi:O-acetyl-ADP-ribose deacetylase (regulator of RNase III)|nr:macro domain-containing protein [Acidobacteriota bacterium]HQO20233.1 macro domain-containing protein [Acidobacteriota bacterium]HQQ46924.1 macro domain-containing protein [Acidobacteriota bacterium]